MAEEAVEDSTLHYYTPTATSDGAAGSNLMAAI